MKVFLSPQAQFKQISNFPQSCVQSEKLKELYKCVLTKQTTFYYRITEKNEIEIIAFFDTRQNPDNLKKDL